MSILNSRRHPSLPFSEFDKADGLKKSWKTAQRMADHFWRDWHLFYLPTLQRQHQ